MDNISQLAQKGECWFPKELSKFAQKGSGSFLDLGANIGGISLVLAACGWKGYAVEASSSNCELLKKSILLNGFDITLCEKGVWNKTGELYFLQNGPWGVVFELPGDDKDVIEVICLDDYKGTELKNIEKLDLIKMDIEGSEVAALEGMGKFLENVDYPCIFAEANALALHNTRGNTVGDMIRVAAQYGYESYRLFKDKWCKFDETYFIDSLCTDYMFVHKNSRDRFCGDFGDAYPRQENDKIKDFILYWLKRYLSEPEEEDPLAYTIGICSTLRDFPNLQGDPEIISELEKVKTCTFLHTLIVSALSWYTL